MGALPLRSEGSRLYAGIRQLAAVGRCASVCSLVCPAGSGGGVSVAERVSTDELRPVRGLIERYVREGQVDGAAVAIARRGEIVAQLAVGEAAPGRAAGPDVLWPLASISKLYTAAMVMALVEGGLFTLMTPVASVLPDFTGEGRERATLRHLLTHT